MQHYTYMQLICFCLTLLSTTG